MFSSIETIVFSTFFQSTAVSIVSTAYPDKPKGSRKYGARNLLCFQFDIRPESSTKPLNSVQMSCIFLDIRSDESVKPKVNITFSD